MAAGDVTWESVETWSPALVLAAGVLAAVTAALTTIGYATDATTDSFELAIAPFAFLLLFVGVLGLYPGLADSTPRLARAGAVFAVIGAVFAPLVGVVSIVDAAGLLSGDVPVWALGAHLLGRHAGQVALILFGVAVFRTGAYSRRVGALLLGPATVMLLALVHIVISGPAWATPPLVAANALAVLALGYALRAEQVPRERARAPADSPA